MQGKPTAVKAISIDWDILALPLHAHAHAPVGCSSLKIPIPDLMLAEWRA
jgi:hypothetical protein